jgi:membrane protein implicated in regulation of membrane protease activity
MKKERREALGELGRYLLWELPSWVIAALVLAWVTDFFGLSAWMAAGLFALFIVKDLLLFPVMRGVFRPSPHRPQPIGACGETVETLKPSGYVRVNGELWKAESTKRGMVIRAGAEVIVRDARGLTLMVEELDAASRPGQSNRSR